MARQNRQQRRDRRAQQPALAGGPQAPARRPEPEARREPHGRGGIPGIRFMQESIAELKKVEWPTQQAVISGTAVVLIACLIVGAYLWANDQVWQYVVKHVLLR